MPDKPKDRKIISMLERSGILRRADGGAAEDYSSETSAGNMPGRIEPDIKPLFDHGGESVVLKTAPKQPIPGISTPVLPTENTSSIPQERPQPAIVYPDPIAKPAPAEIAASAVTPPESVSAYAQAPTPAPTPAPVQTPAPSTEPLKPATAFSSLNLFRNNGAAPDTAAMSSIVREDEPAPQPENYTDRYLNVNELYDALALRSKKTDTIYLIEEYLDTIPDSLPDSQRREIVSKLLAASGFDFDLLMGDGVLRVKMLKEYAERFARHTDDYIAARQAELEELNQQIMKTRKLIDNRKELHKKQFYTIEAEAQRLKEILTFVSG